jgi:outer membrane immunogenic protein
MGLDAASAADLPVKARPMSPAVVAHNWTGCYVGGNVGGGWDDTFQSGVGTGILNGAVITPNGVVIGPNGAVIASSESFGSGSGSNVVGGAQIGCDYQFASNWVVGVQGMFDFGNIRESHPNASFPGFVDNSSVKDVVTVTGRIGYLIAPELLGYAKGGGAWARIDYNNFFGVSPSESANGVDRQGWTVGFGMEWMFAPGWSTFGEFNHMDFGSKSITFVAAPGTVNPASILSTSLTVNQFLLGVNYRLSWAQPVVAKF